MTRKISSYPFQPPRERGTWRAFVLAVLMHVLLGFFLYHGIQWQNSTPAGAEAELWTDVPDMSTPRPAPPPPPPAPAPPVPNEEADIALQQQKRKQEEAAREAQLAEQQRRLQLQQQQQQEAEAKRQQQLAAELAAQQAAKLKQQQQAAAEKLKQQQLAEQKQKQLDQQKADQQAQLDAQKKADAEKAAKAKAQAEAQAKKLDAERRARIAQMQGLAAGGGDSASGNGLAKSGTGSGAGGTATSAGYAEKVQRRVRPNIVWAGDTQGLETVVAVRCAPTGTLLSATIIRGSGNSQWDDAALRAVQRSDPMPLDTDGKTPASFTITLRPAG